MDLDQVGDERLLAQHDPDLAAERAQGHVVESQHGQAGSCRHGRPAGRLKREAGGGLQVRSRVHPAGIEHAACGSKLRLTRSVSARRGAGCGSNGWTSRRSQVGARISVACPPRPASASRMVAASRAQSSLGASQIRPPAQSNSRSLVSEAVQSTSSLAAAGGTDSRHSNRSGCSSATSRISRQSVAVSCVLEARELDARALRAASSAAPAVGDRRPKALEPDRRGPLRMAAQRLAPASGRPPAGAGNAAPEISHGLAMAARRSAQSAASPAPVASRVAARPRRAASP